MEPARSIIASLGGDTALAKALGLSRTVVARWKVTKSKGGTGGLIPFRHVPRILEIARARGHQIDANDFLPSRRRAA